MAYLVGRGGNRRLALLYTGVSPSVLPVSGIRIFGTRVLRCAADEFPVIVAATLAQLTLDTWTARGRVTFEPLLSAYEVES